VVEGRWPTTGSAAGSSYKAKAVVPAGDGGIARRTEHQQQLGGS